ncbi:MAG: hypothetical protein Q7K38_01945 [Candidatus Wildermuthbacteria bacterium]|nr:hypothetical protein [Candidatus Wildermuthbacteria bacterium]
MMITIRDANTSEQFGRTQGKLIWFTTEEESKMRLFGGKRIRRSSILVQIEKVLPEGGQDCWTFKGQVLSLKGPIKNGTPVSGFYIGSNGRTDLGWGNEPNTGSVRRA